MARRRRSCEYTGRISRRRVECRGRDPLRRRKHRLAARVRGRRYGHAGHHDRRVQAGNSACRAGIPARWTPLPVPPGVTRPGKQRNLPRVARRDAGEQSTTRLLAADSDPVYVPSSSIHGGFILFLREAFWPRRSTAIAVDGRCHSHRRGRRQSAATAGFPRRPRRLSRFGPGATAATTSSSGSIGKGKRLGSSGRAWTRQQRPASPDGSESRSPGASDGAARTLGNSRALALDRRLSRGDLQSSEPGRGSKAVAAISPDGHVAFTSTLTAPLAICTGCRPAAWAPGTAAGEVAHGQASERLLAGRAIPDLRRSHGAAAGPVDPSDRATARGRAQADSVSRHAGRRDLRPVLARRQVDRLQLR